jgi:hypothetical protein
MRRNNLGRYFESTRYARPPWGIQCSSWLREPDKQALLASDGSLVLNDIPVFDENPILQANDVRCYPVHRRSDVGEPAMNDDVVTFCKNHPRLMLERRRRGFDEVEEPVSSWLDMGHLPKESERRNAKGDCIFEQSSW